MDIETKKTTWERWRRRFNGNITSPAEDALTDAVEVILERLDMSCKRLEAIEKALNESSAVYFKKGGK
jgi:hypothetical protein